MRLPLQCEADALDAGGYEADDDSDLETPAISSSSHLLWPFLGGLPQRSRSAKAPPYCARLFRSRTGCVVTEVADACWGYMGKGV